MEMLIPLRWGQAWWQRHLSAVDSVPPSVPVVGRSGFGRKRAWMMAGAYPARILLSDGSVKRFTAKSTGGSHVVEARLIKREQLPFVRAATRLHESVVTLQQGLKFRIHWERQPPGQYPPPRRSSG